MNKYLLTIVALLFTATICLTCSASTNRPSNWAVQIKLKGVPNLHKVSDTLYRSAQPTAEGMKNLKVMGIKTIVNLRSFHSDKDEIGKTKLEYEHIYMKSWHLEEKEIVRFLKIIADTNRTPVLVHCMHGADRTGTMCTIYRIFIQNWTKKESINEMIKGGFNFQKIWKNLPKWINKLDINDIKMKANLLPKKTLNNTINKK